MTLEEDLQKITRFSGMRDLNRLYNQKYLTPEELLPLSKNLGSLITNGEDPDFFLNQTPEAVQNEVDNKLNDYSKEAEKAIQGNEERIMDSYIKNLSSFVNEVEEKVEDNEDFKDLPEEIKDRIKRLNILTLFGGYFKDLKIAEKYLDKDSDDYDEELKNLSKTLEQFSNLENALDDESRAESAKDATVKRYGLTDNAKNFRKDWSGDQYALMREIYRRVIAAEFLKDNYEVDEEKVRKLFKDNISNYVEMAKYISYMKDAVKKIRTETKEKDIRKLALAA